MELTSKVDDDFVKVKDVNGNTILHTATTLKQTEIKTITRMMATQQRYHGQCHHSTASLMEWKKKKKKKGWLEKNRDSFLIAATLIAGMEYEAALNPPGGTWEHKRTRFLGEDNTTITYITGKSIVAARDPDDYLKFWRYNTVAFIAYLSTVLLLLCELLLKRAFYVASGVCNVRDNVIHCANLPHFVAIHNT
ncbi:hypothetical protein RJ639_006381 [Escallonia herrerae]|uniref:PGG domain-containing protein n=1 Tax=Escallonia herrerae TaxID=1293975 RepID=A0AA88VX43_9ASTE|nr:hypothetical protein RJ639_006381 [Escallonia herrerae]